jgi:hypothetical protein
MNRLIASKHFTLLSHVLSRGNWGFPNPATSETWLQLLEGTNNSSLPMQLISAKGILVYSTTVRGRFHKIETANLPKGLYLVRVWNGEKWMVEKLVVR